MSKLLLEHCNTDKLKFSYSVSITKDGLFSTTIPQDIVEKLESVGIELGRNQKDNHGYFVSDTLKGLKDKIYEVVNKYSGKKLIEEKIVLLYSIDTTVSYCKGKTGKVYPNGQWQQREEKDYNWVEGTIKHDACNSAAYGFSIFVEPKLLKVWEFPNGEQFKDYQSIPEDMIEEDSTLDWLNSIAAMNLDSSKEPKEIDYSEPVGLFFKSSLLYIINLNERLKEMFTDKVDLKLFNNQKRLSLFEGKKNEKI
jgi:hypothetical protein